MLESWWAAHELEFVFWGGLAALLSVVWLVTEAAEIRRERKQRRKDGLL